MAAETQASPRAALVAGASGLTGGALVQRLLRTTDYARVYAVTRRPVLLDNPRFANRILKFEELGPRLVGLRANDAFCCIGAAGGSRAQVAELQRVDLDLTLAFARAAQSAGATRLVVISAAGASRGASDAFLRIKGEMEAALRELKLPAVDILQPGPVLGSRSGDGLGAMLRTGLLPLTNPLLRGAAQARKAISGADLAAAMLGAARSQRRGFNTYAGGILRDLAESGLRAS